jgi:hypothetical protein
LVRLICASIGGSGGGGVVGGGGGGGGGGALGVTGTGRTFPPPPPQATNPNASITAKAASRRRMPLKFVVIVIPRNALHLATAWQPSIVTPDRHLGTRSAHVCLQIVILHSDQRFARPCRRLR